MFGQLCASGGGWTLRQKAPTQSSLLGRLRRDYNVSFVSIRGRPFHLFLINYGYYLVGMVIVWRRPLSLEKKDGVNH
jgi:hypothetical protein